MEGGMWHSPAVLQCVYSRTPCPARPASASGERLTSDIGTTPVTFRSIRCQWRGLPTVRKVIARVVG